MPAEVRERVFARMFEILSGRDTSPRYAPLDAGRRRAVLEILRDTKPELPDYIKWTVSG